MIEQKVESRIESVCLLQRKTAHEHGGLSDDLEAQQIFDGQLFVIQSIDGPAIFVHGEHVPVHQHSLGMLFKDFHRRADCAL